MFIKVHHLEPAELIRDLLDLLLLARLLYLDAISVPLDVVRHGGIMNENK